MTNILKAGQQLSHGQSLTSPNGTYELVMQSDGNLVLYRTRRPLIQVPRRPVPRRRGDLATLEPVTPRPVASARPVRTPYWSTDTWSLPADQRPVLATMQSDGNFVLYDAQNRPRWASGTWGPGLTGSVLTLQDDGNLVVYRGSEVLWASGTPDGHGARAGRGHVPGPLPTPGPVPHFCTERVDVSGNAHPTRQDLRPAAPPRIGSDGRVTTPSYGQVAQPLAIDTEKMWDVGQTLRVKFVGSTGSARVRSKIREYAEQWTQHANIAFQWVDPSSSAEIKIACDPTGRSWSTVGRDALWVPFDFATMNFGWFTDSTSENEFSRVVLHEFGHALGLVHEHQSPAAGIAWDREKVYEYYAGMGWDRGMVDANIFERYDVRRTNYSAFDPASIMLYSIPAQLTLDGFSTGSNTALSATDKDYISRWYPRSPTPQTATGMIRTGDDCDEIDFRVEYGVTGAGQVELQLRPAGGLTWWKAVEVAVGGGGYRMLEMQDGSTASRTFNLGELDTGRPMRFWKAKAFGVHTRLGYTWDIVRHLPGGSRLTLTWKRDAC